MLYTEFTSLSDLFNQTPSHLLWEASSHMLQLMREGCSYTYPPLSIVRYSFIQLSELEQCRVKKLAQCFKTAAQNSNPCPFSRESETLPPATGVFCTYIFLQFVPVVGSLPYIGLLEVKYCSDFFSPAAICLH